MLLKQLTEVYDILDSSTASGQKVADYLRSIKADANVEIQVLSGAKGSTDMVKVRIPGKNGKSQGGTAPTIGLLGRLGGLGARPEMFCLRWRWRSGGPDPGCKTAGYAGERRLSGRRCVHFHPCMPRCSHPAP